MTIIRPNPITAAQEVAPRDGLAGAVGLGVIVPPAGTDPLDPDSRWESGYQLWGPGCPPSTGTDSGDTCLPEPTEGNPLPPPYPQPEGPETPPWTSGPLSTPFLLRAGVTCQLQQLGRPEALAEWQAEARRLLHIDRWGQIAYELWTGAQVSTEPTADNRWLAHPDATVLGDPAGVSVREAVSLLEDALGATVRGDVNLIHAPKKLVAYLAADGLISSVVGTTSRIFTHGGSLVVADRQYPGTGPEGEEPDGETTWIYGTGVLSARLGSVLNPQSTLETATFTPTNDAIVRAEQQAAISWLCGHFAVRVRYCSECG